MDVGFIGVGRMGRPMVRNLTDAGHSVRVWDESSDALDEAAACGAIKAASAPDAFRGDAVISMLPNDDAIRDVFLNGGILPPPGSSLVHVNMATVSMQCVSELAELHAAQGVGYVSAPVFGRPEMAARREINILAAGKPDAVARVQPLLDSIGRKTWYLGEEPHNANVTKIAGNLMVACIVEAMGEAAALARAYRMQPTDLLNVVVGSLFDVPIYRIYAGLIAGHKFEPPGFDIGLALKDTRLALGAGEAVNLPLPFASILRDNYLDALAHGDGDKDWSIVTRVATRRAALDDS
jgi:3-hydroxyisobutyrate dehydrogenase-like beta-hydroxyacid dehydrogenase